MTEQKLTMSLDLIHRKAQELDDSVSAHKVYLEGYPFTTFAILHAGGDLDLPPVFRTPGNLNWDLFWDIRVFTDRGDWHAWRRPNGTWSARTARIADFKDQRDRHFVLAGHADQKSQDGWTRYAEANGTQVWVPSDIADRADKRPLCLRIVERLEAEEESGLVGIVDAAFCGIEPLAREKR